MPRLAKRKPAVTLGSVGYARLDDYVHRVGFSADGTKLAACAASGEVAVWDVSSFKRACQLAGHRQSAQALAWHPSRLELVTGGQDGVVKVWDPETGGARATLEFGGQGAWVENLAWSPDGKLLAASVGKRLRLWDCAAQKEPQLAGEVPAHQTTISALAWMPRGAGILSACYGGAWLWKLGRDKPVRPFPYDGALLSIAVNPNGEYLASGNLDGSVHLFRTDNEQNWHMSGYPMKVTVVCFDHDGQHLFTVSGPDLVAWSMKKFEGTGGRLFKGHVGWIREMASHPSQSCVATAGEDGLLCIWEPQTTKPILSQEVNKSGGLSSVAWSPQGTWLATGTNDGAVSLFSVEGIGRRA
jgi:WD40 repeat protein